MSAAQFDEELFWLMTVYIGKRSGLEVLAKGRQPAGCRLKITVAEPQATVGNVCCSACRDNQAFTHEAGSSSQPWRDVLISQDPQRSDGTSRWLARANNV